MTRGPDGQPSIPDRVELSDADQQILGVVNSLARQLRLVAPFALLCTYVAIVAGSVTHEMLLTGERVTLPLAAVPLPAFFWISGTLIFVLHAYLMMQHHVLGQRIAAAERQLRSVPLKLRWQLLYPSLPVVRLDHARHGRWVGGTARFLSFAALASPLLILLYMQIQILPSHREPLIWAFRVLVVLDACLILFGWPGRLGGPRHLSLRNRALWIGVVISATVILISMWGLRTPDADCRRPKPPLMPEVAWTYLVEEAGWPWELPAVSLSLPGAELASLDPSKPRLRLEDRDLRCADLRGAVMPRSVLRGSDLRGARLTGADLRFSDLSALEGADRAASTWSRGHPANPASGKERPFGITDLSGANLDQARLDGSRLVLMQGDLLSARGANFRGTDLTGVRLRGADLTDSDLRGAILDGSVLDEARFDFARLMAARLVNVSAIGTSFLGISGPLSVWNHSDLRLARYNGADLRASSWTGAVAVATLLHDTDLRASQGIRLDRALLPRVLLDAKNVQRKDIYGAIADIRGWDVLPPELADLEGRLAEALFDRGRESPPTDSLGTLKVAKQYFEAPLPIDALDERLAAELDQVLRWIAEFPLYSRTPDGRTRRAPRVGPFPYSVYYRERGSSIELIAIRTPGAAEAAEGTAEISPESRTDRAVEVEFGVSQDQSLILGLRPDDPTADLHREALVYSRIFDYLIATELEPSAQVGGTDPGRWKHPALLCTLLRYSSESSPYNRAAAETARQVLEARGQGGWLDRYTLRSAVAVPGEPLTLELEGRSLTCYW